MQLEQLLGRLYFASCAVAIHFVCSLFVAGIVAGIVFGIWYPFPYNQISGGRDLFIILMAVDVVAGPLLTFVVFDKKKPNVELRRDVCVVVIVQLAALAYGLFTVIQARPVFLAFEGDRFRVVRSMDVENADIVVEHANSPSPSFTGPQLIGVRLVNARDPEFLQSIQLAIQGIHPSFRPSRWLGYETQQSIAAAASKPLINLKESTPDASHLIGRFVADHSLNVANLRYLPLVADKTISWIVILEENGSLVGYIPIDGWE